MPGRTQRRRSAGTAVPVPAAEPDALRLRRLSRSELPHDAAELARYLIGKTLVHDVRGVRRSGRIVETEAYVPGDAAGHAFIGETARNGSLFRERGRCYVYFIYGCWHCMNCAAESEGIGAGVLLRALEPLEGIAAMTRARGGNGPVHELARGPGRLCSALGVDLRHDGLDLCEHQALFLADAVHAPGPIGESARIGISKETERVLRFYERGNRCVSGPTRLRT